MENITITKAEYDELIAAKVKFDLVTRVLNGSESGYIKSDLLNVICGVKKGEQNGETEKADS
jgi:hypothetical protein